MNEIWKKIDNYEEYFVSNLGRIKSIKGNKEIILKQNTAIHGYPSVTLYGKGKKVYKVHRLVANSFLKNKDNKKHVEHINTIKQDNRVENLRWASPYENYAR